jgi:UDP-glucuronate decarboxylase
MRVLVTGGAGFIGSHLCDKLLDGSNHVIAVDNLCSGRLSNIDHLFANSNFSFINHDVTTPLNIEVDQIYNLASIASPVFYQNLPVDTLMTNVLGSFHLLNLALKYNATILQASTSEVYGDPLIHPQKESYWGNVNPIGTRACYDEGKRAAETLFFDYKRSHQLKIKVARIFNTYGPRMRIDDGRVVSNFITQALNNEPLSIYGVGSQTRSFCFVSDLVEGLIKLMNSPDEISGPLNLGNNSEITIDEFAQLINSLIPTSNGIVHFELPSDDPVRRRPDISLAAELLDWFPVIDLVTGIRKTIESFVVENNAS